jgi:cytochrome c-type biogenesis protein
MFAGFLAYLAGMVTILNPCILPVLPIVIGSALQVDRRAPVALAMGLVLSFSVFGAIILAFGFSIGLTQDVLRVVGGWLFIAAGLVFLLPKVQMGLVTLAAPLTAGANRVLAEKAGGGLKSQFAIGALLGIVWAPCVGPTLGAAIASASQGEGLFSAIGIFALFGLGVSTSLLAFAYGSRATIFSRKEMLRGASVWAKPLFGAALVLVGAFILFEFDKRIETAILDLSPAWLIRFTTAF